MAYVPGFTNDIFVSYSHIDDQAVQGGVGWVTDLHQRLQIEVEEELGARVQVWRDPRIGAADDFGRDLDRQVRASALVLAVLSPGYQGSAWCEREARGFLGGSLRTGDLWIDTKCRLVKIRKRPADVNLLPETGALDFFELDRASDRAYELSGGSERFNRLLSDLAHEIGAVLRAMRTARSVFLGTASEALAGKRERVKRELEAREYRVLTGTAEGGNDARDIVRAAVKECSLSILFDGDERAVATEEGARQVIVLRGEAQAEGEPAPEFAAVDEDTNVEWLVDPPSHALNHTVLQMLDTPAEPRRPERLIRVYLICDRPDHPLLQANRARHLRDHLLQLGFEVKTPLAEESDAAEFSRDNRSKLRQCDAVLLYWGTARQSWFEQRLRELMQARGWRRGRSFVAMAGYVSDPENPIKQNYETRELDELIKQFRTFDHTDSRFTRFVERLATTL